ncbi:hypothetical protein ACFWFI_33025, partial [Streptomyces sp. NPDC060209]|uniref:hypothetical protein n=1 Tax=Streptomyces sp. NPDC060209 TaxID=3347073 RepID=UPI0036575064
SPLAEAHPGTYPSAPARGNRRHRSQASTQAHEQYADLTGRTLLDAALADVDCVDPGRERAEHGVD